MAKILLCLLALIIISSLMQLTRTEESLTHCRRATTTCVLTPEVTEGPYYWNTSLMRQNITEDREGIPFRLQVVVMDVNTCSPILNSVTTTTASTSTTSKGVSNGGEGRVGGRPFWLW